MSSIGLPPPAAILSSQSAAAPLSTLTPPDAASTTAPQPGPGGVIRGVMAMGDSIDKAILSLAQAWPEGAPQFSMARDFVKAGLAAGAQKLGVSLADGSPPESIGNQFPSSVVGQGY